MKALVRVLRLCALVLCSTCLASAARADGWLSGLNPFASKKPAATDDAKHLGDSGNKAGLGDAKPTAKSAPPKTAPAQPSMFSRMGAGTSNMMAKTKNMFKPAPKPDTTFRLGAPREAETDGQRLVVESVCEENAAARSAENGVGVYRAAAAGLAVTKG